jgi:hypothetical protein
LKEELEHGLLANYKETEFTTSAALPDTYQNIRKQFVADGRAFYAKSMTELFKAAPAYLSGPNNAYLLSSVWSEYCPQFDFVSQNDNNWKISGFDYASQDFMYDGSLNYANWGKNIRLYKIRKSKNCALTDIDTNPRFIMDKLLENQYVNRTLSDESGNAYTYRIKSYGEPAKIEKYVDSTGRVWLKTFWFVDYNDSVIIAYILPLPDGPAMLTMTVPSAYLYDWQWDMEQMCSHLHAVYTGSFGNWLDFLKMTDYIPAFLKDGQFVFDNMTIPLPAILASSSILNEVIPLSDAPYLSLTPSYYDDNGTVKLGINRVDIYDSIRSRNQLNIAMRFKPDPRLNYSYQYAWSDIVNGKFPWDGKPAMSPQSDSGSVSAVLEGGAASSADSAAGSRCTLYLKLESSDAATLSAKMKIVQDTLQKLTGLAGTNSGN